MSDGWLGVFISCTACIIGASIVYIDKFFHNKSILDSRAFSSASMALASGVLLFSSLSVLFPQAQKRLDHNDALLYTFFFAGATLTVLLTRLIHYTMPDAIHTCGNQEEEDEHQKLILNHHDLEYGTNHVHDQEIKQTSYYSIGIQTAIAICVHKFPEGLVMFVSSKASTALGLSVCVAMSIHNLTEGFMIALPLYYATRSRTKAFLSAAVMGGLSQPVGALIGLFLMKHISKENENLMFGIVFACVSGMMSIITIQSMLPQAITAGSYENRVSLFFFLGVFLVGVSSIFEE